MDYEKKYNEALNWIRELYPGLHGATKEDAEHFFPELRESEDERIKKFLYHTFTAQYLCKDKTGKWHGEPVINILAYLEKQKDHFRDDTKKVEQNPAKWSEEDREMLDAMIDIVSNSLYEPLCPREGMLAWLKSLRPQPYWKPSEEQMNCLCAAVIEAQRKHNESVNGFPRYHVLKELYEQLLKL